jgi:hypothetical protein
MTPLDLQNALHIVFQTRSPVDRERAGPWRYAAHPSTDLWCVSYAVGDGSVSRWGTVNLVGLAALAPTRRSE